MELPARAPLRGDEHPKQLGPYRVIERLGSGGQACVYRARRLGEGGGADVALKRLHPELAEDERELRSFGLEARLAYLIDHPAIRRVHAIRKDGDDVYLVMEHVDGVSLKEVLKRASAAHRRLPVAGVVAALHALCEALHYAHDLVDELGAPAGVVHRDVSPSNVIVTRAGRLALIDLGIARSQAAALATDSGRVKGKYGYMAPEVLWGAAFDRRADVFSIGVVAWELVTTTKLFPVVHRPLDLERIRGRVIEPPSRVNPACPPDLDAIILRALATEPDERWPTCAAMAAALADLAARERMSLAAGAIGELVGEPRTRLARGTPAGIATSPTLPMVTAPPVAEAPRSAARPTLLIGALLGAVAMVVVALAVGLSLPVSTSAPTPSPSPPPSPSPSPPPSPPPRDAKTPEPSKRMPSPAPAPTPAPVMTPTDAPPPLAVRERDMERLAGAPPRSRSSSARYRARVCVGADGKVERAVVLEGPARLHARIERALLRWRYRPFHDEGGARPVCFEVASRLRRPA